MINKRRQFTYNLQIVTVNLQLKFRDVFKLLYDLTNAGLLEPGVPWHLLILAVQLTLSQPRVQIMPTQRGLNKLLSPLWPTILLLSTPRFSDPPAALK